MIRLIQARNLKFSLDSEEAKLLQSKKQNGSRDQIVSSDDTSTNGIPNEHVNASTKE